MKPENDTWTPDNTKLDIGLVAISIILVCMLVLAIMEFAVNMLNNYTAEQATRNCTDITGYDHTAACETNTKGGILAR